MGVVCADALAVTATDSFGILIIFYGDGTVAWQLYDQQIDVETESYVILVISSSWVKKLVLSVGIKNSII